MAEKQESFVDYIRQELTNLSLEGASEMKYQVILNFIVSNCSDDIFQGMTIFIDCILAESVSISVSRNILRDIGQKLICLPAHISKPILEYVIDKAKPRFISYETEIAGIRQHLAGITSSNSSDDMIATAQKRQIIRRDLIFLIHSYNCRAADGDCDPYCRRFKSFWEHKRNCLEISCPVPFCESAGKMLGHWSSCKNEKCETCVSVKEFFAKNRVGK